MATRPIISAILETESELKAAEHSPAEFARLEKRHAALVAEYRRLPSLTPSRHSNRPSISSGVKAYLGGVIPAICRRATC